MKIFEIILLVCSMAVMYFVAESSARGDYSVDFDDETRLTMARCLMAETSGYSGPRERQWASMVWVLQKRAWDRSRTKKRTATLLSMTMEYCAVFDSWSKYHYGQRAVDIRRSTFENPIFKPRQKKNWGNWEDMKRFLDDWVEGKVGDPCTEARHFGAHSDVAGKPIYIHVCKHIGEKRGNKLYMVANGK